MYKRLAGNKKRSRDEKAGVFEDINPRINAIGEIAKEVMKKKVSHKAPCRILYQFVKKWIFESYKTINKSESKMKEELSLNLDKNKEGDSARFEIVKEKVKREDGTYGYLIRQEKLSRADEPFTSISLIDIENETTYISINLFNDLISNI